MMRWYPEAKTPPRIPCIPNKLHEIVEITDFCLRCGFYIQFWIKAWTIPAVIPVSIAQAGFVMKDEAEPTTMPPAIGA